MTEHTTLSSSALPSPTKTPLVRDGALWIKPERDQHTGSVKYRMVYAKLCEAIASNAIDANKVLVEATAGSTGVALAFAAQRLGVRAQLHAYTSADPKKCERIRGYGAELILHAPTVPIPEVFGIIARSVSAGSHWSLGQYDRDSTAKSYAALADEVLSQLREQGMHMPTMFVCAVGTGGLIQGVGARLRAAIPGLRVIAIEPAPGAAIDGIRNTEEQYLGASDPYDRAFPDAREVVAAPREAVLIAGAGVGMSASAAITRARERGWKDALIIAPD